MWPYLIPPPLGQPHSVFGLSFSRNNLKLTGLSAATSSHTGRPCRFEKDEINVLDPVTPVVTLSVFMDNPQCR